MEQQRRPVEQRQPSDVEQPDSLRPPAPSLAPGLTARVELTVTDADTAQAIGSGDVPVLGTPRLLALAEAATVAATATQLPAGMTTVGLRVELEHRLATPVGRAVTAQARLAKVDGRRLLFEVTVTEAPSAGAGGRGGAVAGTGGPATATQQPPTPVTVAEGRVERALVDRRRFLERALRPS